MVVPWNIHVRSVRSKDPQLGPGGSRMGFTGSITDWINKNNQINIFYIKFLGDDRTTRPRAARGRIQVALMRRFGKEAKHVKTREELGDRGEVDLRPSVHCLG